MTTGITRQQLAALLDEYGLAVTKNKNVTKNLGKHPHLVLIEALNNIFCINTWPTPDHVTLDNERGPMLTTDIFKTAEDAREWLVARGFTRNTPGPFWISHSGLLTARLRKKDDVFVWDFIA